jgi:hypothetical protein
MVESSRRSGKPWGAAAFAIAATLFAGSARANGRYPLAGQIALSPSRPDLIAARATFGILVSSNAGRAWDWICESAVGYSDMNEDPSIGWTAQAALVGMFEGLAVSPDQGCSWSTKIPGNFVDLVVRRDDPHAALALTASYDTTDDAGNLLYTSVVYATSDDGATWSTFGPPLDPSLIPVTIEVSADGTNIFVSGYTFPPNEARQGVILRSTDHGAHYTRSTIALAPFEAAPFISAVDPTNPLRVYVRVSAQMLPPSSDDAAPPGDRLIVSDDGGVTFRTVLTSAGPLLGFALTPDGSKVYVGGPDDGVHVATSASLLFEKKSTLPVECLTSNGTTLFACSDEKIAFLIGASTDDGATFSALLHSPCLRGALACPSSSSTAQCPILFDSLSPMQIGTGGPLCGDAGAADASPARADATLGAAPPTGGASRGSSCACQAGAAPSRRAEDGGLLTAGLLILLRRLGAARRRRGAAS